MFSIYVAYWLQICCVFEDAECVQTFEQLCVSPLTGQSAVVEVVCLCVYVHRLVAKVRL